MKSGQTFAIPTLVSLLCVAALCCLPGCFQNEPIDLKIRPISSPSASVGKQPTQPVAEAQQTPALVAESPGSTKTTITTTSDSTSLAPTDLAIAPPSGHPTSSLFSKYDALLTAITVFALAVFVGFEVITKVPTTLHTPLMSGSNAISGITVVGAMIVGGYSLFSFSGFLGFVATALAMINVVGGFLVTHRMLAMFKRK